MVEFYTEGVWLGTLLEVFFSISFTGVLIFLVILMIYYGPSRDIDMTNPFNRTLQNVFCEAIGLRRPNNPCRWASYNDSASLVVYTPEDGLCICRPPSYPVLPRSACARPRKR